MWIAGKSGASCSPHWRSYTINQAALPIPDFNIHRDIPARSSVHAGRKTVDWHIDSGDRVGWESPFGEIWKNCSMGEKRKEAAMADLYPRLTPPAHPTSCRISLADVFDGIIHCPFCGNMPAYYEDFEFHSTPCEHLLAFYVDDTHQFISQRLMKAIRFYGFSVNEDLMTCEAGDELFGSWSFICMAGIIPYSLIFEQTYELKVDLLLLEVAFAPLSTAE